MTGVNKYGTYADRPQSRHYDVYATRIPNITASGSQLQQFIAMEQILTAAPFLTVQSQAQCMHYSNSSLPPPSSPPPLLQTTAKAPHNVTGVPTWICSPNSSSKHRMTTSITARRRLRRCFQPLLSQTTKIPTVAFLSAREDRFSCSIGQSPWGTVSSPREHR